ncbi:MAG TPA: sulfotransferase [Rhizomicrobium sp.]|jgi:tetratricopeptide (TPR) repeat protein|nr:sulfotransferase [Rhizomicrobium sp.]
MTVSDTSLPSPAGEAGGGADDFDRAAEALREERPVRHARLRAAAELIEAGQSETANKLLREFLREHPRDAKALFMMAEVASRSGRHPAAQALLARCLELAPDYVAARYAWVGELIVAEMPEAAGVEADRLLEHDPRNPLFRALKARALEAAARHSEAAVLLRDLTRDYPSRPDNWERLGHALRGSGELNERIAAYRRHIALGAGDGTGWWNLADMKTFRFESADIERMEAQLARPGVPLQGRICVHFALGKAYAEQNRYDRSFENYAKGNALNRIGTRHDPETLTRHVKHCMDLFTRAFFRDRSALGCMLPDPIFIVGMPRGGSTLVEQILASHSRIEATRELRQLNVIAANLARTVPRSDRGYPALVQAMAPAMFKAVGEAYLESTRPYRRLGLPFFIDKMGHNFTHVGLIHLILPNAKIIDVRRHPLDCGVSQFTQMFSTDTPYFSGLTDIGRHYRDYVGLMAHFDAVLPGKVHRIIYEELVERPEHEIRRLLDYLGVEFEPACLAFHKTERVILTPSAEQVRRPINRDGLDRWRAYEPWLGPLKAELGLVLEQYPAVPFFD